VVEYNCEGDEAPHPDQAGDQAGEDTKMTGQTETTTATTATQGEVSEQAPTRQLSAALQIGKQALEALGGIAHHTTMNEWIAAHGTNPTDIDINTAIWNDTRKHGEASPFRFLKRGIFALSTYQGDTCEAFLAAMVPARQKPAAKQLTPEQKAAKIAALEAQLAALKDA
jgi:hypothetical protein